MSRRRRTGGGLGLSGRIFTAMALVVVAGASTMVLVSLLLAPTVFNWHLDQVHVEQTSEAATHVQEGFALASLVSTSAGVVAAVLVAVVGALLVARRISAPVTAVAAATGQLAGGDYSARVAAPGMGPELADLADAVNTLAERLEAAEATRIRLLADLAHELRTPVAAIEATVEAIGDGVLPADQDTLDALTAQAARLHRLLADLGAVSRAEERSFHLRISRTDLTNLARGCATAAQARFALAGITLEPPDGPPVVVRADPDRLAEVVDQLLDNAVHHTPREGTVSLTVRRVGPSARLDVTDTGAGFDAADAGRLFDRFYRADPARSPQGGTGIGLTIGRALVQAHGGSLTATSPGPGRGATFTITLPTADPGAL